MPPTQAKLGWGIRHPGIGGGYHQDCMPSPRDKSAWKVTTATVISCRPTLGSWFQAADPYGGYRSGEFVVKFSYIAGGKHYRGTYKINARQRIGRKFQISFDPQHPKRNTGSDFMGSFWIRMAALGIGAAAAALLAKLKFD